MTILGKSNIQEENSKNKGFTLPVVVERQLDEISMGQAFVISSLAHPATVCIIWMIIVAMALMGIKLDLFPKHELKTRDIEFVLVDKEDIPIDKRTKNRADRNSRAGGKHDPKKKVSMPSPQPSKASNPASSASSELQKMIQKQQKQVIKQQQQVVKQQPTQPKKNIVKQQTTQVQPQQTKTVEQPKEIKAPQPKTATPPKPSATPTAPKIAQAPKSSFQIPVPKMDAPKVGPAQGGPVAGTSSGKSTYSGGSSSGTGKTPAPSFSPNKSSGTGTGQGRYSGSSGGTGTGSGRGGTGSVGNPGPGNPKGAPGIDAVRDPDFGPYMKELQRRIKMNWDPPKGNESKRVVLLFKISRDGRLLSVNVSKSSGVPAADKAAVSAVQLTAPFRPLPAEYKGQSVDIQFTFDYNVFGANGYY